MKFNKDQRKKLSDIAEKLGITLVLASIGDVLLGKASGGRLALDLIGAIIGIGLLIMSIAILEVETMSSSLFIVIVGLMALAFVSVMMYLDRRGRRQEKMTKSH